MRREKKTSPIIAILLLLAALAALYYLRTRKPQPEPGPVSGKLVIRFLDIGQGDAELIQLPGGETILIDSGPGKRGSPMVELLKQYDVKTIDLIVASHPHEDHIGEMRDILRAFEVKEFWDAGFPHTSNIYENMLVEIKNRGIKLHLPKRGETRKIGQATLEVLNPGPSFSSKNENDASIVVRLTFGSKKFLFTGDAEFHESASAWQEMLTTAKDKLQADLLKAAHHGSSNGTNEEIINAVRPSIVTISCAVANSYHHPHPKVMSLLERRRSGTKIYRTDLEGTITATCDGNNIEVSTEKQVAQERLYLTGDEVAGNLASDGRELVEPKTKRGGKKAR